MQKLEKREMVRDPLADVPQQRELLALCEWVQNNLKALGTTASAVGIDVDLGFEVSVRGGELDELVHHQSYHTQISAYRGQQVASVSVDSLEERDLQAACERAWSMTAVVEEDPFAGLPLPQWQVQDPVDCDLYHPSPLTVTEARQQAEQLEAAAVATDPRLRGEGASVDVGFSRSCLMNSQGLSVCTDRSMWSRSCVLLGQFGSKMAREGDYEVSRYHDGGRSLNELAKRAAERTLSRDGARALDGALECPVIFIPELGRRLLAYLASALRGSAIYQQSSWAVDGLGRSFLPESISWVQQPHLRGGVGSSSYDGEGVATRSWAVIERGKLQDYLMGSYSARQLGRQSTGQVGGPFNGVISDERYEQATMDDLICEMGQGLLVTDIMGHGVNNLTGDFSQGAFGFWVEGGRIAYPVHEITLAGNLQTMFQEVQAISGADKDTRGSLHSGAWWMKSMSVGSQST